MKCRTGKESYSSQEKAVNKAALTMIQNRLEGNQRKSIGLTAYQCGGCGGWHIGHRPGTERLRAGKDLLRP